MWDLIVSVPDHCLSFYFTFHFDPDVKDISVPTMSSGLFSWCCKRGDKIGHIRKIVLRGCKFTHTYIAHPGSPVCSGHNVPRK